MARQRGIRRAVVRPVEGGVALEHAEGRDDAHEPGRQRHGRRRHGGALEHHVLDRGEGGAQRAPEQAKDAVADQRRLEVKW